MKPQKQKYLHRPWLGEYGDCHRTAIACILDMDRDDVPNWGEICCKDVSQNMGALVSAWLAQRGYAQVNVGATCSSVEAAMGIGRVWFPGVYYIFGGESQTGVNHSVVGCGGEIVWDPSLTDSGIVGPCDDGLYWFTFLTPFFERV